ncbi:MAG: hypothetical protein JXR03_06065 [Cyclobacteriaceae bacterium]
MKNIIAALLLFPLLAHAQEELKVSPDERTLEVQFTPFGSNPININGIRFRKFKDETSAFRLNVFLGLDSDSNIKQQKDDENNRLELNTSSSAFSVNIRPGFERHLPGTDRLSPYFGGELDLAIQTSSEEEEFQNTTNDKFETTLRNQNGFFRFGINAIAGMDFYVAKKLYLGTEFGFGFSYNKLLSVQLESDEQGFTEPDHQKRGGSFNLGPNVNAQIRLGYAF